MILLIDNYDSFVFNLARYLEELGMPTRVVRHDVLSVEAVLALKPRAIVLSPGPCTPREAGICVPLVQRLPADIPLLGVCLGHQALAAAWGGRVLRADVPVHGQASWIYHDGSSLFAEIPSPFRAARYHSLVVEETTLPDVLRVTARTAEGIVMGLEHRQLPQYGVQFHPESILTEYGHRLLANFLRRAGCDVAELPAEERCRIPSPPPVISSSKLLTPPIYPLAEGENLWGESDGDEARLLS
ncbi:MAG: glutamine amidotransferase [Planctomycetaceae bacterium]|nr:MAG: glutamine amidotransferase [Planctomycetaceae bacterium]